MPQWAQLAYLTFFSSIVLTFLLVTVLYKKNEIRVAIKYSSNHPNYVGAKTYVQIPSKQYVQVWPGVFDRKVEGPNNILQDEEKYRDFLSGLDYEKYLIVFVRFEKGANFAPHLHPFDEFFTMLEGQVEMLKDKETNELTIVTEGEQLLIPAHTEHHFNCYTDGCCVIEIPKP